ncbi:Tautomerase [Macrophomina phaseolina MS6]|uniref:Tautomerase n=2 Tax=Macrophomina phaseolina TaxID=35725 RepID=K2RR40_MACPH|nr:Tautomerase [Macrophomina phaseolina MS6]KAH7025574.1 putative oxalocrotonate tautomerase [Macrophomina phaseolina]
MPLWIIYHPPGTFEDDASKEALSKDITKIYAEAGLPAFYVIVNFVKLPTSDTWVGGEPRKANPFIRMTIDHIAVRLPNKDQAYYNTTKRIDAALKPHIADKGYDWEYHVDETERRLWKINGLIPPPFKSEEERIWAKENKPVPWKGGQHKSNI